MIFINLILTQDIHQNQQLKLREGVHIYSANDITPSNFIEAAAQVTNSEYEDGTFWGKQVCNRNKYNLTIFSRTEFC